MKKNCQHFIWLKSPTTCSFPKCPLSLWVNVSDAQSTWAKISRITQFLIVLHTQLVVTSWMDGHTGHL